MLRSSTTTEGIARPKLNREPTGPGVILRKIIEETDGLTQDKLAHEIGVSFQTISKIVNGKSALTPLVAHLLGRRFDMHPQFWLNMQNAVDLYRVAAEMKKAR